MRELPALAPLTIADLKEVAKIEVVSFAAPWPTSAYTTELTTNRLARYIGARLRGTLVGFGGIWLMVDEAHVTTMAVLPAHRRTGIATALLLELLQEARRGGARVATLDVRVSNHDAQRLYHAFGFVEVGRRIRYYDDNGEDALVMTTAELESPGQQAIEQVLRRRIEREAQS